MAPVPWSNVSPKQLEDIVSVLLSRLHPKSTRIDGSGGDGGRDVQLTTPDGIHAFELKSFTGRMGDSQRTQVEKSLTKAAGLKPVGWTLIVPIDFTPGELDWFEGLRALVPFPIDYHGQTWLNAELAERPAISRYFLEDAANEVVRLAEILNQEKTVLAGGAPDAMDRVGAVVDQLNAMDPFYEFQITAREGMRSVTLIPRYKGAEIDSPIHGTFSFKFPNDEAGRLAAEEFQQALDFGTKARVPAEYIEQASLDAPQRLGGDLEPTLIEIGPSIVEPTTNTYILVCSAPDDATVSELPIEFDLESRGERGSIWKGSDRTGHVAVVLRVDGRERTFNVHFDIRRVASYYPQDMLPVARFLAALVPPNRFALNRESGERMSMPAAAGNEPWIAPWMPQFMADLVLVQTAAGMVRKVPGEIVVAELNAIAAAAALLRGEEIESTWAQIVTTVSDDAPETVRSMLFQRDESITLITHQPHKVTYAGVEYRVGRRVRAKYESVRLAGKANRTAEGVEVLPVPKKWKGTIPGGTEVVLRPGSTDAARIGLVSDIGDVDDQ